MRARARLAALLPVLLAAALLLAPDEARAQAGACGVESGTNEQAGTHDCTPTEAASGVFYWVSASANNPLLTLTIPGVAGSTTTIPTIDPSFAAGDRNQESAIVIVGNADGVRTLTIGATGAVAITQRAGITAYTSNVPPVTSGNGVLLSVTSNNAYAGAFTLDIRSGVTIGTSSAPMLQDGIQFGFNGATNSAAHAITSAARIYAASDGIYGSLNGAGKTTITNSGAIDANRGIAFYSWGTTTGSFEIINSGALTGTSGTNPKDGVAYTIQGHWGSGIFGWNLAEGDSKVTNSGAISAAGHGVVLTHAGASGDATVVNSGAITAGAAGRGIWIRHTGAAGDVSVTNNDGGDITAGLEGILASKSGAAGAVSVTNHADITARGDAAAIATATRNGDRIVGGDGIQAAGSADGVSVVNRGDITAGGDGIVAYAEAAGAAVSVTNSGDVAGGRRGITAQKIEGEGDASVTHSAGEVSGGLREGIAAFVGAWQNEDPALGGSSATPPAPVSEATARVTVTGGMVSGARGWPGAVTATNYENGSVEIVIGEGAELRSFFSSAVIASLTDRMNTRGRIRVASEGTLRGAGAIYAVVSATRTAEQAGEAGEAPLIDVTWTGTHPHPGRVSGTDRTSVLHAVQSQRGIGDIIRGATAATGIRAEVISWRNAARVASASDDPGAFADNAAQAAFFDDAADAATKARAAATIAQLRNVLTDESFGVIPGADDIDANDDGTYSDAEITAYLTENLEDPSYEVDGVATPAATPAAVFRRNLLRDVLRLGYSDEERAALDALINSGDEDAVNAALDAVPGATDDWKAQMRAFIGRQNAGDIRIAVNGGSIDAAGDGVGAFYSQSHPMNGAISVTIAEGAEVTGDRAGVYVSGAGDGLRIEKRYAPEAVRDADANADLGEDDLVTIADHLKQVVRVNGTVTGGTDAAVHLSGGGALIVGEKGRLIAGSSGRTILVNDPGPAIIYIAGEARGGEGAPAAVHLTGGGVVTVALTGTVDANGAARAIQGDAATTIVVHMDGRNAQAIRQAAARVKGAIGGEGAPDGVTFAEADASGTTGFMENVSLDDEGALELPDLPAAPETPRSMPFSCGMAADRRCELYEALPSVLLAMNRIPSRAERMAAPRGANGVWARVEAAKGEWTAEKAVSKNDLASDYDVFGGRAGFDFSNESVRVGLSAHVLKGKAEMSGVGEILVNGTGFGASATWTLGDFYVDVQGQATWLDAEIDSSTSGKLEKEATGLAGALGVEVGSRVALAEGLFLTPRAGLTLTTANLGDFTDSVGADPARVSVEDAKSAKGVAGLTLEASMDGGGLFGTLDLAQEFTGDTSVEVSDRKLDTDVESATLRVGAGGAFAITESVSVRASGYYETAGSGNSEYGGGVDMNVRF